MLASEEECWADPTRQELPQMILQSGLTLAEGTVCKD